MSAKPAIDYCPVERQIGKPVSRVDGPLKVMGKARFAAEIRMDGLLYAAFVYSTIARGHIASLDTAKAEQAPGVALVMTHKNAPRMKPPASLMGNPFGAAGSSLPVMQDASIHWNGEPVAVILAETQEQADHAASLIRVSYDVVPAATSFKHQKAKARSPGLVLRDPAAVTIGDAEAALRGARFIVDEAYRTPRHNHNAIELHAATVVWTGDTLTVHDTSQAVHLTQVTLAQIFGIAPAKVQVLSPFVGGGFGGKILWSHQILAIAAAKLAGRPVRVALSREGVYRLVGGRTLTEQRVALGYDGDGPLSALIHTGVTAVTPYNNCPEQFSFPARKLYAARSVLIKQEVVDLDMVANTFMRAPGESVGTFALECAIDELAGKMGIDPIALREKIEPDKDPLTGQPFSERSLIEAYRRGAEKFGWHHRAATPGAQRNGDWLIGLGVASATFPYLRMPGGQARIRLGADGRAVIQMGSHEMGMGTATVQIQAAADLLSLPPERISFEYGDTDLPAGTIAGGSSQTASILATVKAAADGLFAALLQLAGNDSPLSGLRPDEIEARGGGLGHRGKPERWESYASILRRSGRDHIVQEAASPDPVEEHDHSMHSYGAQFCEVRVNAITGETRVSRFLGSFDVGRILNPKTATSQLRGGIVMGIGLALTEETLFDARTGRIVNASLAEYHIPVQMDVPQIDIIWNDIPDPYSPLGARGIGEISITGVGAAIANAIYNATGKRIRDLPITLDKLL